jgi:hypothetical protein
VTTVASNSQTHTGTTDLPATAVPVLGEWVQLTRIPDAGRSEQPWLLVNRRDQVSTRITTAAADALQGCGQRADYSQALTPDLLAELDEGRFLAGSSASRPTRRRSRARAEAARSLALLEVRTGHADQIAKAAARLIAPLTTRAGILGQMFVAVLGVAAFGRLLLAGSSVPIRVTPGQVPLVVAASLASVTVHELSHALVVARRGGTVDYAGLRLHLGAPTFFVESADAMLLGRRDRLVQAAAGVWAEWLVTSIAALWLWGGLPSPLGTELLSRFVLINTLNIAVNLLPFVGLDGSWLLADAVKDPDLTRNTRGALKRWMCKALLKQRPTRHDRAMAAYSLANTLVALALLALSVLMWTAVFGGIVTDLAQAGAIGWATLAVAGTVLTRPALVAVPARLSAGSNHLHDIVAAVRFRAEFGWRVRATLALIAKHPELANADETTLGAVAGALTLDAPARTNDEGTWTTTLTRWCRPLRVVYLEHESAIHATDCQSLSRA